MCVGHQKIHDCGHSSVQWNYCPSAVYNPRSGRSTPCDNATSANPQESRQKCPLLNCHFRSIPTGGYWYCCKCNFGNYGSSCENRVLETPIEVVNPATGESFSDYRCLHMMCDKCSLYGPDGKLWDPKKDQPPKDSKKRKGGSSGSKGSSKKSGNHGSSHGSTSRAQAAY
ncbi:hypothetical protein B0H66DRAFT_600350 [Apodospora peruviana]|uniref:Uncharacterized protein n=1 Tax=Apodospora peruviana TaxID=516989 RepID=A0AAE0IJD0_9PEZI|nr:hypothetical protein B0H66DRAFT_600350 [Apodospora peruviana]